MQLIVQAKIEHGGDIVKEIAMRTRFGILMILALLAIPALACQVATGGINIGGTRAINGSGDVVEEQRLVSDFTQVEVANQGNLFIEIGETEQLRIEAEDNLLEYIETEVRNGKLTFRTANGVNLRTQEPINYYLTAKELDSIAISSSGDVEAPDLAADQFSIVVQSSGNLTTGEITSERIDIRIGSSGDVDIEGLNSEFLEVRISSSGNLTIHTGSVIEQEIGISSSGDYEAKDLSSSVADVDLSSSGSVTIRVSESLRAELTSSGDVRYLGNPTVNSRTSSSGEVIQITE
jgi:hypothetical protein